MNVTSYIYDICDHNLCGIQPRSTHMWPRESLKLQRTMTRIATKEDIVTNIYLWGSHESLWWATLWQRDYPLWGDCHETFLSQLKWEYKRYAWHEQGLPVMLRVEPPFWVRNMINVCKGSPPMWVANLRESSTFIIGNEWFFIA